MNITRNKLLGTYSICILFVSYLKIYKVHPPSFSASYSAWHP